MNEQPLFNKKPFSFQKKEVWDPAPVAHHCADVPPGRVQDPEHQDQDQPEGVREGGSCAGRRHCPFAAVQCLATLCLLSAVNFIM